MRAELRCAGSRGREGGAGAAGGCGLASRRRCCSEKAWSLGIKSQLRRIWCFLLCVCQSMHVSCKQLVNAPGCEAFLLKAQSLFLSHRKGRMMLFLPKTGKKAMGPALRALCAQASSALLDFSLSRSDCIHQQCEISHCSNSRTDSECCGYKE